MNFKYLIKHSTIFTIIEQSRLYSNFHYNRIARIRKKQLIEEARIEFHKGSFTYTSFEDYKKCFNQTLCSFSEYMFQYELWKLPPEKWNEFVTRLEMRLWYERNVPYDIRIIFWNKKKWLSYFKKYINRLWFNPDEMDFTDFENLKDLNIDFIAKPDEGSLGFGIFKFHSSDIDKNLFSKLKNDKYLVEQFIHNENSLASFHPNSLNTIRITTLKNGVILGTFIRFGNNGNIVDNAHAGGIFATINPETGIIETSGIDTDGNQYENHPFSGLQIKGFHIPRWYELIEKVREMHLSIPQAPIVGWDICIDSNNNIEVIEGNHMPDFDVLQSPQKTGIRKRLNEELQNVNLQSL